MIQIHLLSGKTIKILECNDFYNLFNIIWQNYSTNNVFIDINNVFIDINNVFIDINNVFINIYDFALIPLSGKYKLLSINYNNIMDFDYDNKVLEYNLVLLNNKKFKYYLNDDYNNNIIKAIKITDDMSINKIIKLLDYSNYYKEDSHIKIIIKEHSTDNLYIEANIRADIFDVDILSMDNYNFNIDIANEIIFDVDMYYYEYEEYL